jgi:hypothetical protein
MKVYVVGAGLSKVIGYPLGAQLFSEIDSFVRGNGRCHDRFAYESDWPDLCRCLETDGNPLIEEAYRTRNLEYLFTILDMVPRQSGDNLAQSLQFSLRQVPDATNKAKEAWESFARKTEPYGRYRAILLCALEAYLRHKHSSDFNAMTRSEWDYLRAFGRKLCHGDVVLTFNYDCSLERVLLEQKKWSPRDGYGFNLNFQESLSDPTSVPFDHSPIKVVHLHGAVGWYGRPAGGVPCEAKISLDPQFLRHLGIAAADVCLPRAPSSDFQIVLHPSFLKSYEIGGEEFPLIDLWQQAARALRVAQEVFVIGYSLPEADSAALTLLLTVADDPARFKVVNPSPTTVYRLRQLFSGGAGAHFLSPGSVCRFEDWLNQVPDSS